MRFQLVRKIESAFSEFQTFLFEPKNIQALGLFRIVLCGSLFYIACWRHLNIDFLGVNSFIPRDEALLVFPEFYRSWIQFFFWPDQWVQGVHLLLIVLLGLATLGLSNRPLLFLTWILQIGILHRNNAMIFGAETIGTLFLFYISLTKCCEYFTLKNKPHQKQDDLSSIFFRVSQAQIMIIYAYTGFEKLKGQTWWDGTALWTVFVNPQFSAYDLTFTSSFPWIIAIITYTTVIFEIYFPAMVLSKRLKYVILGAGFFFHIGIALLLSLMPFSLVMLSTYFLFFESHHLELIKKPRLLLAQLKSGV